MAQSEILQSEPGPHVKENSGRARQIQTAIQDVGRRQWWLWSSAMMVTLLLTLGIASFAFPGLLRQESATYPIDLDQALRGLAGLVVLFNIYTVYQQLQIRRLQKSIAEQVFVMDKMEARTEEVYKLAVLDPLTGLYNRRCGEQRLKEEMLRSERHGHPLTLLALDLDKLKYVNDTFGHAAGDEVIKSFAARINKAIRGSDVAIRQGGDEFLLLLPECKSEEVRHVLLRLSGIKIDFAGQLIPISFSAGWSNYISGESADDLLRRADEALYAHKRGEKTAEELNIPVA
jgi:diguanylate cyclase (GGDEF)-like protein